jgi:hypothetical protein
MLLKIIRILISSLFAIGAVYAVYIFGVDPYLVAPITAKKKADETRYKSMQKENKHLSLISRQKKSNLFRRKDLKKPLALSKGLYDVLSTYRDIKLLEMTQSRPRKVSIKKTLGMPLMPGKKKITSVTYVLGFLGEYRNILQFLNVFWRKNKGMIWKKMKMETTNYPNVLCLVRIQVLEKKK